MNIVNSFDDIKSFKFDCKNVEFKKNLIYTDKINEKPILDTLMTNKNLKYHVSVNNITTFCFDRMFDIIYNLKIIGTGNVKLKISTYKTFEYTCNDKLTIDLFTEDNPLYLVLLLFTEISVCSDVPVTLEFTGIILNNNTLQTVLAENFIFNENCIHDNGMYFNVPDVKNYFIRQNVKPTSSLPPVKIIDIYTNKNKSIYLELTKAAWSNYNDYYITDDEILFECNKISNYCIKIDYNESFGHFSITKLPENLDKINFNCEDTFFKTDVTKTGIVMYSNNGNFIIDYDTKKIQIKYQNYIHIINFSSNFDKFKQRFDSKLSKLLVTSNRLYLLKYCKYIYWDDVVLQSMPPKAFVYFPLKFRACVYLYLNILAIRFEKCY